MLGVLAAVLWAVSVLLSIDICLICIIRCGLFRKRHPPVQPVNMTLVVLHFISLLIGVCVYPVYMFTANAMSRSQRTLYVSCSWPAAIILIGLIALQLVLLYVQANRAMRDQTRQQPVSDNS